MCPTGFRTGCVDINVVRAGTMVSIVPKYVNPSNYTDLNIRLNMNLNGSIKPFYCVGSPYDDCNIYDSVASTFNFCNTSRGTVTANDITVSNIQYTNRVLSNIQINLTTFKFEKVDNTSEIGLNHNLSTATTLNYWTITCKVCDRVRPTNCVNAKYEFNVLPIYTRMANSSLATENTENSISIYPNPSNGVFTIHFNNNLENNNNLEIFNLLGQNVYKETVINQKELKMSLTHLPKGTYIVKVANNDDKYITKIIIE